MVLSVDYNSVFINQKSSVEKSKKAFVFVNTFWGHLFYYFLSSNRSLKRINETFVSQLLRTKGIIAYLEEKLQKNEIEGISVDTVMLKELLDENIKLLSVIEKSEVDNSKLGRAVSEIQFIITETIENYYTILRIAKRVNPRPTTKATSDLARSLSKRSIETLEKVLNAH